MKGLILAGIAFGVMVAVAQTNYGTGRVLVGRDGNHYLRWDGVSPRVVLQVTTNFVTWETVLRASWERVPPIPLFFCVPIARTNECEFYRLVSE